jgi:hypothetical protein
LKAEEICAFIGLGTEEDIRDAIRYLEWVRTGEELHRLFPNLQIWGYDTDTLFISEFAFHDVFYNDESPLYEDFYKWVCGVIWTMKPSSEWMMYKQMRSPDGLNTHEQVDILAKVVRDVERHETIFQKISHNFYTVSSLFTRCGILFNVVAGNCLGDEYEDQ